MYHVGHFESIWQERQRVDGNFHPAHQSAGQIRDIVENSMIARAGSSKVAINWSLQNLSMDLGQNIFPLGFKVWENLDVNMWQEVGSENTAMNFSMF